MLTYQTTAAGQEYHIKGVNPSLLIVSGIHGDEAETAKIVEKKIETYYEQLQNFIYVKTVSPSAVAKGTRKNNQNHDLNRSFFPETDDIEAFEIMKLLKINHFDVCFDFHEDPESPDFYVYDCFENKLENTTPWTKLIEEITDLGIGLLNGVDDPNDPALCIEFKNGLHYFPDFTPEATNDDGMIGTWLGIERLTKKYINPETPGKISTEKKDQIIDAIFRRLILHA